MENIDPLDRKQEHGVAEDDHSQVQQPVIKREIDSLDDFEHLGHDSSPLREEQKTEDLLDLRAESPGGEVLGVINKGSEVAKAATQFTDADDVAAHFDRLLQEEKGAKVDTKMDSNLLQMGDTFPEGKPLHEDKLDKFLDDFPVSGKTDEEVADNKEIISDFKSATKNFMDMEREFLQPVKNTSDLLDRYSDSESDAEQQFKQPESIDKKEDFKVDATFKDVDDTPPTLPEIPKQETPKPQQSSTPPPTAAPTPKPVEKVIEEVSQCVRKEPEVKKAEQPAQKVEKARSDIIEAEAMFCKMGLGEFFLIKNIPYLYVHRMLHGSCYFIIMNMHVVYVLLKHASATFVQLVAPHF